MPHAKPCPKPHARTASVESQPRFVSFDQVNPLEMMFTGGLNVWEVGKHMNLILFSPRAVSYSNTVASIQYLSIGIHALSYIGHPTPDYTYTLILANRSKALPPSSAHPPEISTLYLWFRMSTLIMPSLVQTLFNSVNILKVN